jgi:hypothetical protein
VYAKNFVEFNCNIAIGKTMVGHYGKLKIRTKIYVSQNTWNDVANDATIQKGKNIKDNFGFKRVICSASI